MPGSIDAQHTPAGGIELALVKQFLDGYVTRGWPLDDKAALDEEEFLRLALDIANSKPDAPVVGLLMGVKYQEPARFLIEGRQCSDLELLDEKEPELRAQFARFLRIFIEDPLAAVESAELESLGDPSQRLVVIPSFRFDGKRLRQHRRVIAQDVRSAFAYAAALFLSVDEFADALCACKLPSCGKLFFAERNPKGGAPRRVYCSDLHRIEYFKLTGPRRVAEYRRRKAGEDAKNRRTSRR